jgi:hypothetical protein
MVFAVAALAGCERPASTSSTTVVQPTKETVVQRDVPVAPSTSSTTIVNPPAAPAPNVTVETSKPEATTERSRTTTTERIDTPAGSATRTQTETSKTTTQ